MKVRDFIAMLKNLGPDAQRAVVVVHLPAPDADGRQYERLNGGVGGTRYNHELGGPPGFTRKPYVKATWLSLLPGQSHPTWTNAILPGLRDPRRHPIRVWHLVGLLEELGPWVSDEEVVIDFPIEYWVPQASAPDHPRRFGLVGALVQHVRYDYARGRLCQRRGAQAIVLQLEPAPEPVASEKVQ